MGTHHRRYGAPWLRAACSLACLGAVGLFGCTPAKEREREAYAQAITQHFAHTGRQCLPVDFWPVYTAPEVDTRRAFTRPATLRQMEALGAVGLASAEPATLQDRDFYNYLIELEARRFSLTPAAQPFLVATPPLGPSRLCWGQKVLHEVVEWKSSEPSGSRAPDRTAPAQPLRVLVTYTYDIAQPAEWARNPFVQTAFPSVETTLRNVRSGQAGLILEPVPGEAGSTGTEWRVSTRNTTNTDQLPLEPE